MQLHYYCLVHGSYLSNMRHLNRRGAVFDVDAAGTAKRTLRLKLEMVG
jgi:hypothetical protein